MINLLEETLARLALVEGSGSDEKKLEHSSRLLVLAANVTPATLENQFQNLRTWATQWFTKAHQVARNVRGSPLRGPAKDFFGEFAIALSAKIAYLESLPESKHLPVHVLNTLVQVTQIDDLRFLHNAQQPGLTSTTQTSESRYTSDQQRLEFVIFYLGQLSSCKWGRDPQSISCDSAQSKDLGTK